MLTHHVPLKRIVVKEHQRIHADVENALYAADVVCLVVPVCHKYRDVVHFEHHFGVLLKHFFGVPLIVLRAYGKYDSALFQLLYPFLELGERLAYA